MTTVDDLVIATKRHLTGSIHDDLNRLAAAITTSSTTLTFEFDLNTLTQGSIIAVDDELMYVWSTSPTAKTAVVQRAYQGTTAALHDLADIVDVDSPWARPYIIQSLVAEIRSYEPRLFAVDFVDVEVGTTSTAPGTFGLDIDSFYRVLRLHTTPPSASSTYWRQLEGGLWDVNPAASQDTFSSGYSLDLLTPLSSGSTVRVTYARPFDLTQFVTSTDLENQVGLPESAADLPPLGAAARLVTAREAMRTFTEGQSEPRHAQEVPPGAALNAGRGLLALRDRRLSEEAWKMLEQWPPMGY